MCRIDIFNAVKAIGKKGHHAISYGETTWNAFRSTDVRTVNGVQCWWDMYSSNNVAVSSGHPGMNIEHSVANSWWGGTKNDAYKDIVHLNPSNSDANSKKGNYPLGEINGASKWDNGVTFIGSPVSGQGGGCTLVYEPHDMYKGDFARVFMYMFTVYDDITWKTASGTGTDGKGRMYDYSGGKATLQPWASTMMLAWSAADPVSEKEVMRNNGIHKEQGNRNPFIDLPDLADYLWGSKKKQTYHIEGEHNPEPGPIEDPEEPETPEIPENPGYEDPSAGFTGKYLLAESMDDIVDGGSYLIVGETTMSPMSVNAGNNCLKPIGGDSPLSVSGSQFSTVHEDAAHLTLTAVADGYLLRLSDKTGKELGYLSSPKVKNVSIAANPDEAGTVAKVSVAGGKASIEFGAGPLKYNPSAKMFRTYPTTTGGMEGLLLYRHVPDTTTGRLPVEKDRFRVIVKGSSIIAPAGAMIFDLNGRPVNGENLEAGVYIVVSPSTGKAIKAIIGN